MARTVSDIVIEASPDEVMAVITDFSAYPEWATGVKEMELLDSHDDGSPRLVRMVLDQAPIRDSFELEYEWVSPHHVTWGIAEGSESLVTMMDGAYILEEVGEGHTRTTYQLAVDVKLPLLGMIKRKAEKIIIDTALKGLKKRVESGA